MNNDCANSWRRLHAVRIHAVHIHAVRIREVRVLAGLVIAFGFVLRLLYAWHVELIPEEAYYWNYSRHLDIGYLDHPPMVAWLIKGGTSLFGETEFGVRFGALCCGVLAAVFIFRLTFDLFGESAALVAVALAQVLPFFFLSGLLMTPDAPLTAAWAASLYFLQRALVQGRSQAWLWGGLTLGLGSISKYTIGLVVIATLCFMLMDRPARRWFRRWEPYVALLIAAAVFSPVVIWNVEHDWASFLFQTARRLADPPRFALHELIGSAVVLLTPTGLFAAVAAMVTMGQRGRGLEYLQVALWVPLTVFIVFSLRHEVKLDWTGAPWTAAVPLMALGFIEAGGSERRWLRLAWPPTIAIMLLFYGVGWCYLAFGIPGVGYTQHTELVPLGWRQFGRQVEDIANAARSTYGPRLLVVGMDRYAIASELAFYAHDRVAAVAGTSSAHLFDDVGLMYEQWFPVALQSGRPLLLVAWHPEDIAPRQLEGRALGLEPVQEGLLSRNGSVVRRYYYRIAQRYEYPSTASAGRGR